MHAVDMKSTVVVNPRARLALNPRYHVIIDRWQTLPVPRWQTLTGCFLYCVLHTVHTQRAGADYLRPHRCKTGTSAVNLIGA